MSIQTFDWMDYVHFGQVRSLPADSILFRQGEKGSGFYYLADGEVKISILREDGYEKIIDYVSPGRLIGEQGLNQVYFATAETTIDSTLYYFSEQNFRDLCAVEPEAAQEFGYSLIAKIRMMARAKFVLNAPADIQLAYYLHLLYEKTGSPILAIDQNSISNYIGKSRVTVWKIFKEWKNDHLIDISDGMIHLKDVDKLKQKFDMQH
ncbi:Crp/Fnr family transcriptional regulator [Siminovitchia sediminis]|uniref:Crp/Fnr family transcriptional regulator n=1 Tax=Siminovitchia sediminis TaxID=1274353 RepID=A0ABW4KKI3_9BACI